MRRRDVTKAVVTLLAGLACGYAVIWVAKRAAQSPVDGLVVFVSPGCPYSIDLVNQLEERNELAERLVVLPADPDDLSWDGHWCRHAFANASSVARVAWKVIPRATMCVWAREGASEFHAQNYTYTPAWLVDGAKVPPTERNRALARFGLVLEPTNELHLIGEEPRRVDRPAHPGEEASRTSDPMQWATGHTVGM